MKHFEILLGTKLASTPGVQLAIDLSGLALAVAVLLVAGVTNPWAWILLPGGLLVAAIVRTAIVARRNTP
ncbi:hypothetical protein [Amycolatopsis albispora]|uniref:Uncharacterized protein n=1 Tax=Amycolatopsis albispora TaxID=1804986 RepID=A0A344LFF9_9PSEU|nr:hypothetical protein [Amycolatopsis albispora]AXB46783.1 hypothetical protein A4R43_33665 [Amycolatopsis albispora]